MDALDRTRQWNGVVVLAADHFRRGKADDGPQAVCRRRKML